MRILEEMEMAVVMQTMMEKMTTSETEMRTGMQVAMPRRMGTGTMKGVTPGGCCTPHIGGTPLRSSNGTRPVHHMPPPHTVPPACTAPCSSRARPQ